MKKLALASMVAAAAAVAAPAQAVTVMAEDGWTLGVSGSINQFATFTDTDSGNNVNEIRDGLLPAFLNFDLKAPTMNGLDIAAHISISPSTNGQSYQGDPTGNVLGNSMEQREVYFTVDGSFGQVLAGKALGLYGSHNILTDQTLFGVGYGTTGNLQTTLGGINLGYDYANWRSQIRYTTPDMNGFKAAFAVVDANQGTSLGANSDQEDFRYEADLSYAGAFDGGSYSAWLSGMFQDNSNATSALGDTHAEDNQAWTVGGTLKLGGFEAMAQYSDSEQGTYVLDTVATPSATEYDQYIVQAGYRFAGTTLVSAQYNDRTVDNGKANGSDLESDKWTVGIYHDVNANLKLVAEYSQVEIDNVTTGSTETDILSLGGFVFF
jgi:predicted porin